MRKPGGRRICSRAGAARAEVQARTERKAIRCMASVGPPTIPLVAQSCAYEVDVLAQRIELFRIAERNADRGDARFQLVERFGELLARSLAFLELVFDHPQITVPAEDARADAEAVERRHQSLERDEHGDDREERHPHAVDQIAEPERQVALEERRGSRT